MTESKIQAESVKWFNNNYCLKFHEPRYMIEGAQNELIMMVRKYIPKKTFIKIMNWLKALGLNNGTSDAKVYLSNGETLFIEFKTPTGRQSKSQKDFQKRVESLGFSYHIVRSVEEFKKTVLHYL